QLPHGIRPARGREIPEGEGEVCCLPARVSPSGASRSRRRSGGRDHGGGMLADFSFLPEQGSTTARGVDELFYFLLGLTAFFTLLTAGVIIFFAVRSRRRPGDAVPPPVHGGYALEITWTVIPTLIGLVIFGWGARVYFDMVRPPDDGLHIYVVGKQWMWKFQHPDGQLEYT